MLANKLMSALSGGVEDKRYVDDVFSAYTYTGNGSTQTINNGIDLAGKGGMVWIKSRTSDRHSLTDTVTGAGKTLSTDQVAAQTTAAESVKSFTSTGFTLNTAGSVVNNSLRTYASWTFRKAPKFFDVVTYTGNSTDNRAIAHFLGVAPGMIVIKQIAQSGYNWNVWHRGLGNANGLLNLNTTTASSSNTSIYGGTGVNNPTATHFYLGANTEVNGTGDTYIAYLFAHDPSADGIIQCGDVTGAGAVSVELGWEPQFVLIKVTSNATGGWHIFDTSRGMTVDNTLTGGTGNDKRLSANNSSAEVSNSSIEPTATGFRYIEFGDPQTYIYLAIRRPNKPPTTGTQVYNAIARTGTGGAATVTGVGFAPDLAVIRQRASTTLHFNLVDRLRGATKVLFSSSSDAEGTYAQTVTGFDVMDGVRLGTDEPNISGSALINHFFKRAPGFFDIVCYTGEGGVRTFPHSLEVAPELMIVKKRNAPDGSDEWQVYAAPLSAAGFLWLNSTMAYSAAGGMWDNTAPNSTLFTVGTYGGVNQYTTAYVAYLFASLPGVSKVGSYTGNGTTQTINCGFTTGARFFLVKTTSTAGSWWVFDSARGIVSAFDPALQLNSTAAEISSADAVDPDPMGIIVNQEATCSLNAAGVSYVYLAIS